MTADEILATVPTMRIDDRATVAACVQVIDSARSLARLKEIGAHLASERLSENDTRALRRVYGWAVERLSPVARGRLYGHGIPETS